MKHKGTVRIETKRLIMRQFLDDDSGCAFRNWMSDEHVTEFLRWKAHRDIGETKTVIQGWREKYVDSSFYQWAIVLKAINEPIGSITVVDQDEKTEKIHVGYCIGRKWWHQGITSEALNALISFFFQEVEVNRIESQHDPNNPFSGRVMEKCGLKYEGTLRQTDWNNNGLVDACVYGILREDWFS